MRLKSFFASTVELALTIAQQELGPEAMLVDSRRTGAEAKHLGEYEVVCAVIPGKVPQRPLLTKRDDAPPPASSHAKSGGLERLSQEVSELKRSMEQMGSMLSRSSAGMVRFGSDPELAAAFAALTTAEVNAQLAYHIVSKVPPERPESSDVRSLIAASLEGFLRIDPVLGRPQAKQKIVALVGPPGAGKTATLTKMAALYGLTTRRPTHVLSLDAHKVAASEQLRAYAAILGLSFSVAETTAAIAQALEEHRQKELILIDTPGFSKNDQLEAVELAKFLAGHNDIDTHLVLPMAVKGVDLMRMVEQYEVFQPDKLLFTRLDETETFGSMVNLVARTGKPVSFLCTGQQVPEDFAPARSDTMSRMILGSAYLEENVRTAVAAA